MIPEDVETAQSSRAKAMVITICALATFMAFLDATVVNIAFPSMEESFPGSSRAELSWVLDAYNIVVAALIIPLGRLADARGRRRMFVVGVAAFVLASALAAVAPSAGVLIATRVVQGVGAAMLIPTSLALLVAAFPAERRSSVIAILGATAAVAAAFGPSLGGLLAEAHSWRLIFAINIPIGVALLVLAPRWLVEQRDSAARLPDFVGSTLLIAILGLVAFALTQTTHWEWSDPRIVAAFVAAALMTPVFLYRCFRHPAPVVPVKFFRSRAFGAANVATVAFAVGFYAKIFGDVLFLTTVWGYSPLSAGLALTPGPIIAAVVAVPAGLLADRYGPRWLVIAGALTYSCGCIWYILRAGTSPDFVHVWLPGTVFTGVAVGFALPTLTSAAVSAVSADRVATASAVNSMARQLGAVLGIAILVTVVGRPDPAAALAAFQNGWTFSAIATGLAVLGAIWLPRGRLPIEECDPAEPAVDFDALTVAQGSRGVSDVDNGGQSVLAGDDGAVR